MSLVSTTFVLTFCFWIQCTRGYSDKTVSHWPKLLQYTANQTKATFDKKCVLFFVFSHTTDKHILQFLVEPFGAYNFYITILCCHMNYISWHNSLQSFFSAKAKATHTVSHELYLRFDVAWRKWAPMERNSQNKGMRISRLFSSGICSAQGQNSYITWLLSRFYHSSEHSRDPYTQSRPHLEKWRLLLRRRFRFVWNISGCSVLARF